MTRVLHLTPHLGGGVGKAVSGLIEAAARRGSPDEHAVVCLEQPEKANFVEAVERCGCRPTFAPENDALRREIEQADVVQLEFWNHPATVKTLCTGRLPPMRLLAWCHVSGLHYPRLPPGLINAALKVLFTSGCSFEAEEVKSWLSSGSAEKLDVVSSGGGLDMLPMPRREAPDAPLTAGYLGSLNYSKLHPDFVSFVAAVGLNGFQVRMIGDETNRADLEHQCRNLGRPELIEFRGYRTDVAAELAQLDVLVYLLNPTHYGTAENALLEAMAMGVVPIVLPNAAERHIVEDGQTGMVIRQPGDLAEAMNWLTNHSRERREMGRRAAAFVRERFNYERMEQAFSAHYAALMRLPKEDIDFISTFGETPADWFRAFHRDAATFGDNGSVMLPKGMSRHSLFERAKGSVFHFFRHFPDDPLLAQWQRNLRRSMMTHSDHV